ncbi:MAG: glycosyltransferase family 39 protein [Bacilli bacterium]
MHVKEKIMKCSIDYFYEKVFKNEFYSIFLIVMISVLYRILTATCISSGGDAFYKWFQVKRWLYGFSFDGWAPLYGTWNHHTARWAITFPTFIFQYVFGTNPIVYYLVVIFFITGATIYLYKIALNIFGLYFAFSTSLLFIFFPVMGTVGSQLLPSVFSCFYMLASFYFIIILLDKKDSRYVLFSAIMLFFAYSAKITNLFFIPGYIYILYKTKNFKNIKLFFGILFALFLLENILFYIYSDGNLLFGKIECIFNGHLGGNDISFKDKYSILYFFSRWINLPISWFLLFVISIPISIYIIFRRETTKKIKYVVFIYLSFIFFETFAVKSIFPLKIAEPFRSRYLSITIPFMLLIINYVIISYIKHLRKKSALFYIFLIFFIPFMFNGSIFIRNNNVISTYAYYKKINKYFFEGYKIFFLSKNELYRFVYVFMDDKYIFEKKYVKNYIPILKTFDDKEFYCISKCNIKNNNVIIISNNYEINKFKSYNK